MSDESKFQKVSDFCSSSFGPLMAMSGRSEGRWFPSASPLKADMPRPNVHSWGYSGPFAVG